MHKAITLLPLLTFVYVTLPQSTIAQSGTWVQLYEKAQGQIKLSQWNEAETSLNHALPSAEKMGQHDIRYALTLGSLGSVYLHEKNYADAETFLLDAIELLHKADYHESELADYCFAYQDLLIKTGRNPEALKFNESIKSLVTQKSLVTEKAEPKHWIDEWRDEYDSGTKSLTSAQYSVAEPHLLKAYRLAELQVGVDYKALQSLTALFILYRNTQNYKKIDQYFPKLYPVVGKMFGPKSPEMVSLLDDYSLNLDSQKRTPEAQKIKQQSELIAAELANKNATLASQNQKTLSPLNRMSNWELLRATQRELEQREHERTEEQRRHDQAFLDMHQRELDAQIHEREEQESKATENQDIQNIQMRANQAAQHSLWARSRSNY